MIGQLRLALRLQRWDFAFVAILCLGLSAVAFWLAADMRSLHTGCGTAAATRACDFVFPFQDSHGQRVEVVQAVTDFVPYLAGLFLGVPVVAREVEQRTAPIAWSLAGSRVRWLTWRLAPLLLLSLVPISVLAVASDQMARAYFPNSDIGFVQYEARGLPLVMRTVLILVSGVAIGALLGRVLPALLVGIGVSIAVSVVLAMALPHWVPSTELTAAESVASGAIGSLNTDLQFRLPNGELMDSAAAEELIYAANEASPEAPPDPSTLPQEVWIGVAASRYPEVLVRESAALGVAIVCIGAIGAFVVGRRRPE